MYGTAKARDRRLTSSPEGCSARLAFESTNIKSEASAGIEPMTLSMRGKQAGHYTAGDTLYPTISRMLDISLSSSNLMVHVVSGPRNQGNSVIDQ